MIFHCITFSMNQVKRPKNLSRTNQNNYVGNSWHKAINPKLQLRRRSEEDIGGERRKARLLFPP